MNCHASPELAANSLAQVKIHEAQKARAACGLKRAENLLDEVNAFGMRMVDGSGTNIEKVIALTLSQSADKELVVLYSSTDRSEDERRVMLRIEQIDASSRVLGPGHDSADRARAQVFRREGMLVRGFGTLALIAGLAALAGAARLMLSLLGLLEIPRDVMGVNAAVSIWTLVTVALSTLLLFVLVRGFYRMRRTVAKPA